MNIHFSHIFTALKAGLQYLPVTLFIVIASLLVGLVLGLGIALIRYKKVPFLGEFFRYFVTITKSIPPVLILMVAYLLFSKYFDQFAQAFHWNTTFRNFNSIYIAILVFSFIATINFSEIFRSALASVENSQIEAAYACGLSEAQTIFHIVIPQMIPTALPMGGNLFIGILKATSLVSMISVVDVLSASLITANSNYLFLESYIAAAIIYWVLAILIEKITSTAEKQYSRKTKRATI